MDVVTAPSDPALDRLVRRVVEVMEPLQVWLFGSRAEGRARPDSDYDLLVVVPDDASEELFDPLRVWQIGRDAGVHADIVPCTQHDFEEERHEVDSLPRAATIRGRMLHSTAARFMRASADRDRTGAARPT